MFVLAIRGSGRHYSDTGEKMLLNCVPFYFQDHLMSDDPFKQRYI